MIFIWTELQVHNFLSETQWPQFCREARENRVSHGHAGNGIPERGELWRSQKETSPLFSSYFWFFGFFGVFVFVFAFSSLIQTVICEKSENLKKMKMNLKPNVILKNNYHQHLVYKCTLLKANLAFCCIILL